MSKAAPICANGAVEVAPNVALGLGALRVLFHSAVPANPDPARVELYRTVSLTKREEGGRKQVLQKPTNEGVLANQQRHTAI